MNDLAFKIRVDVADRKVHLLMNLKVWNKTTSEVWRGVEDTINPLKNIAKKLIYQRGNINDNI
jgi:hypothetical protein